VAGRLLPDTNAVVAFFRGDRGVVDALDAADEVVLAAIVLGELTYGVLNSHKVDENLGRIERLRSRCHFAPVDENVVRENGRIRLALKRRGRPIPENDIWIAATAVAYGAVVVTNDEHFDAVEGLAVERSPGP
jgi:tRNA(fMet)-specific endonuclease VapC